jgi:hypothetical protein
MFTATTQINDYTTGDATLTATTLRGAKRQAADKLELWTGDYDGNDVVVYEDGRPVCRARVRNGKAHGWTDLAL